MSIKEEISLIESTLTLAGAIEEEIRLYGLKSANTNIRDFKQACEKIFNFEVSLEDHDKNDKLNSLTTINKEFNAIKGLTNLHSQRFFKNPTKLEDHLKAIREELNKFSHKNIADNAAFTPHVA